MFYRKKIILLLVFFFFALTVGNIPVTAQESATSEQDTTSKQKILTEDKFENLSTEFQERARRLSYKEGDMVEMRQDSSGFLIILPPVQETRTLEQIREKILSLVSDEIAQQMTDDVEIQATLSPDDLTGYFTVRLRYNTLQKNLQEQARKLGFKKSETISVKVDAVTWEYHVLPKEEKKYFGGYVKEVIPPAEPGGPTSYRVIAEYAALPKDFQKRALKLGYNKKDMVRFICQEANKEIKVLPPPLKFGFRTSFRELAEINQQKAKKLGYKEGDIVWLTFGKSFSDQIVVPLERVGSGPLIEITETRINSDAATGGLKIIFECIASFENLGPATQQVAREKGYKEGDRIHLNYDVKAGQFEISQR